MKNQIGNNSLEVSTSNDIVLRTGNQVRVRIGRDDPTSSNPQYGLWINDAQGNNIFSVGTSNTLGGWTVTQDSIYHTVPGSSRTLGLYSNGV
jgi:hypothetical protein